MTARRLTAWSAAAVLGWSTLVEAGAAEARGPQAPVAQSGSAVLAEDAAVAITLTATDPDGDPVTYAIASRPAHGSVAPEGAPDQVVYRPDQDYSGADSFTFTASDGENVSAPATVDIEVEAVDDSPVAHNVSTSTDEGVPVTIELQGEDTDSVDLTYAIVTGPNTGPHNGTVTLGADTSTATYTPSAGFFDQTDSFTYVVSDGSRASTPARVDVHVRRGNRPPELQGGYTLVTTPGTPVDVTLEVNDPDGDPVAITSVSATSRGTVTHTGLTLTYTPTDRRGTHAFAVTVGDGRGGTASSTFGVLLDQRESSFRLRTPDAIRGTPTTTRVTATGSPDDGLLPTGRVTLTTSGGNELGSALLRRDGTAAIAWTPSSAGSQHLTLRYAGDALYPPRQAPAWVSVDPTGSRLTLTADTLRRGRPGTIVLRVATVSGTPATGAVGLTIGELGITGRLSGGVMRFRVPRLPDAARIVAEARYQGDRQYARASVRQTFTLSR